MIQRGAAQSIAGNYIHPAGMRRSCGAMNARTASPVASPLAFVGALENFWRFPCGRGDLIGCWTAIQWTVSVVARLTISIVLFVTGFMLAVATASLGLLRFAGGEVSGELLLMGAAGALVILWGSDACWGRMRSGLAADEPVPEMGTGAGAAMSAAPISPRR